MIELTLSDLEVVAGGELSAGELITIGSSLGGGVGASLAAEWGLSASQGALLAGMGAVAGAGVTAAAITGWAIGQGLNEYTPIQDWLRDMIDSFSEITLPDTTLDGDE